jgi:hypothetical protein
MVSATARLRLLKDTIAFRPIYTPSPISAEPNDRKEGQKEWKKEEEKTH